MLSEASRRNAQQKCTKGITKRKVGREKVKKRIEQRQLVVEIKMLYGSIRFTIRLNCLWFALRFG